MNRLRILFAIYQREKNAKFNKDMQSIKENDCNKLGVAKFISAIWKERVLNCAEKRLEFYHLLMKYQDYYRWSLRGSSIERSQL